MNRASSAEALAALTICESILLSLTDKAIIDEEEMKAILSDAAEAHRETSRLLDGSGGNHQAAAILVEGIRDGGNSVRRGMSDYGAEPDVA